MARAGDEGANAEQREARKQEREPDVRFTYANERTFLAWNRTALALVATGVAATALLPRFDFEGGRRLIGLPLIALGGVLAWTSYQQWQRNARAMRRDEPLPPSRMPIVLAVGIGVVALLSVIVVLVSGGPD
ncbi:MAG: YidH family protein [Acidimicrobiia bacterium]